MNSSVKIFLFLLRINQKTVYIFEWIALSIHSYFWSVSVRWTHRRKPMTNIFLTLKFGWMGKSNPPCSSCANACLYYLSTYLASGEQLAGATNIYVDACALVLFVRRRQEPLTYAPKAVPTQQGRSACCLCPYQGRRRQSWAAVITNRPRTESQWKRAWGVTGAHLWPRPMQAGAAAMV